MKVTHKKLPFIHQAFIGTVMAPRIAPTPFYDQEKAHALIQAITGLNDMESKLMLTLILDRKEDNGVFPLVEASRAPYDPQVLKDFIATAIKERGPMTLQEEILLKAFRSTQKNPHLKEAVEAILGGRGDHNCGECDSLEDCDLPMAEAYRQSGSQGIPENLSDRLKAIVDGWLKEDESHE